MEEQVIAALQSAFPGIEVDIETHSDGRVHGHVIWAGFAELDDVDRQTEIRSVLKKKLGPDAQRVGILLAYTPDELRAMRAA